ncbi:helicase [Streptomyces badius]|nr:helicase [Streptomyces badius]
MTVKPGVWIPNTKSRRDRLDADQLPALADWAKPVMVPQAASSSP